MNRRLLLALYDRSGLGAYMPVDYKGHELEVAEHMEKFAQLILKECIDICRSEDWEDQQGWGKMYAHKIQKQFGIKP